MSKESVSAIIKSIQKTTELIASNGLSVRDKLIQDDSEYVSDLEEGFSDKIDTIVDNIPDDPPPTPPVSTITGYMWNDDTVSFSVGGYLYIYESDGRTVREGDSTKTYRIVHVLNRQGEYLDEYLDQLYIDINPTPIGNMHLRANSGTYSSFTFWRIEYTEE